jgi:hypothetical protein
MGGVLMSALGAHGDVAHGGRDRNQGNSWACAVEACSPKTTLVNTASRSDARNRDDPMVSPYAHGKARARHNACAWHFWKIPWNRYRPIILRN